MLLVVKLGPIFLHGLQYATQIVLIIAISWHLITGDRGALLEKFFVLGRAHCVDKRLNARHIELLLDVEVHLTATLRR